MNDPRVWSLGEDLQGNLWIGSADGAVRVTRGGFTTYTEADGLGGREVGIYAANSGELCIQSRVPDQSYLSYFNGHGFVTVKPRVPELEDKHNVRIGPQDREGHWWLAILRRQSGFHHLRPV